jgi:predicted permease
MKLPAGVKRLFRLTQPTRDVDEELSFHFERAVEELRARGFSSEEAEAEATRRFGDVRAYRRELVGLDEGGLRERRRASRWEALRDILTHALRSLRRAPALTVAIILTFALGLGANLTMYGIVDRLLLSAPDYIAQPAELRRVMIEKLDSYSGSPITVQHLSYPDFEDLTGSSMLQGAAVWQERHLTLGHGVDARQITGVLVSEDYFTVLGARPALGRFLNRADHEPSAERALVISYEMWQREYAGMRDVLGRTIDFGSGPWTIVGVAPRGMTTLRLATADVWQPLRMKSDGMEIMKLGRRYQAFAAVVRVRPRVVNAAAADQLSVLHRRGRAEHIGAGTYDANARVLLTPLLETRGPLARPEVMVTKWLAGVSLFVLLIACVNVANLLLARVVRQQREIAVRLALGISRARLLGQILSEGLILGLFGGLAALVLARFAGPVMSAALLPGFAWDEMSSVRRLLPAALLLSALTGLLAAAVPALQAARRTLAHSLRQAGVGGETNAAVRLRSALTMLQGALSVVLLVGAGLFVRSLNAAHAVDLGFEPDRLFYVEHTVTPGSATGEERERLRTAVLERLHSHPAIELAAGANTAPFMWHMTNNVRVPGVGSLPRDGEMLQFEVSEDYFKLLGIPLRGGRVFTQADRAGSGKVAVINESMARTVWGNRSPLGECMHIGRDADCTIVVGVAADVKHSGLQSRTPEQYFLPVGQASPRGPAIVLVRPRAGIANVDALIRAAAIEVDPRIRFVQITPAADRLKPSFRSWQLGATVFTTFGLLALVIASLGLYALLAFDVSRRMRELGVRSALGASRSSLMAMIMSRALGVTGIGVVVGLIAAAALAPRTADLLFEVKPYDPMTYSAVAAALLLVAALAGLLPARRASAVDPNVALRAD